jgi:hypothetical protein
MAVFDQFWDEFINAFERLPVWLPGSPIELGEIGVMGRRGWEKLTTLEQLGVRFAVRNIESNVSYSYSSRNSVEISALASAETGQIVPGAEMAAGMKMTFKRGGAFAIRAENCQHLQIDNMLEVEEEIHSLGTSDGGWRRRWVLVSQLTTAQPSIVIVAGSSGAEATVEIRGTGGITGLAEMVAGKGSLQLTHESSLDARMLSVERVPLMWRGRSRRLWRWRDLGEEDKALSSAESAPVSDDLVDYLPAAHDIPERPG